jgi:hypothetical protein
MAARNLCLSRTSPEAMRRSGIARFHPAGHSGEANTVRSAGAFGLGIRS